MILACVGHHPDLVAEREPNGWLHQALARDARLRAIFEGSKAAGGGGYGLTDEVMESFRQVLFKTVQGLFFGLYDRIVRPDELELTVIDNRVSVSPEELAERFRPSPIEDITDKPMSDIGQSSWHVRQPIFIMDLVPVGGGKPIKRAFRLKRETKIEWFQLQEGTFKFGFVRCEGERSVCVIELWQSLVVAVKAPWPGDRGSLRRGRKNPHSRDRG